VTERLVAEVAFVASAVERRFRGDVSGDREGRRWAIGRAFDEARGLCHDVAHVVLDHVAVDESAGNAAHAVAAFEVQNHGGRGDVALLASLHGAFVGGRSMYAGAKMRIKVRPTFEEAVTWLAIVVLVLVVRAKVFLRFKCFVAVLAVVCMTVVIVFENILIVFHQSSTENAVATVLIEVAHIVPYSESTEYTSVEQTGRQNRRARDQEELYM